MNAKKRSKYAYLYIAPFFIVFVVFSLFPILYSLVLSFCNMDVLSGDLTFIGLDNYVRMIKSGYFFQSIGNTLLIWIMSIIPQLTIAFLLALILSNKWFRGRFILRNVYYFPNLVTPVTIGLLFGAMFSYPGGAVNNIISALGLEAVDFQNHQMLARMVIAIAICWKNFGFNIIYFTAGINSISDDVIEAAEVDGASSWQRTTKITIPLMKPILIYVLVTSIIGGLQMFDESKLVFTSVPGDATTTMVKYMYDSAFVRFQFGYGAAVAYGIFIIVAFFGVLSLLVTRDRKDDYGRKRGRKAK
ncbi:MAG TPA: sugar ABC transporter permease [Candidatus Eisenbergiella merdigallinarum]|uniref:Sugar ABC transporter permease n=1 Tax=Candidatus Eisenbergiella merdigallinarum TaxID=2838552 RepID=A0A9D2MRV8_9FIRM|nr:sugar ABC transporter permease [Candidatus Eisenbergiella merdigallinarum]